MKHLKYVSLIVFLLCIALPSHACRFWVGTGEHVPQNIADQLIAQPHSLKVLGGQYQDGWSVGYYKDNEPVVWRGALASNVDDQFDQAVGEMSRQSENVVFAHLRRASSGCVEGVANPHPFTMVKNGTTWAFGHNGGMKKKILIDLIGRDYLALNPPTVCADNPPDTWIDSELYFIHLMKLIEEHAWDVEKGIQQGLLRLYKVIPEESRYFNFFLTDGEAIWVFRKGTSLYYLDRALEGKAYVSSTIPQADQGNWKEFPEDTMGILKGNSPITFISLKDNVSTHTQR